MGLRFLVVVEKSSDGFWGIVKGLPKNILCTSRGDTLEELKTNIKEAIALALDLPDGDEKKIEVKFVFMDPKESAKSLESINQ